jgi:hypothetical protein
MQGNYKLLEMRRQLYAYITSGSEADEYSPQALMWLGRKHPFLFPRLNSFEGKKDVLARDYNLNVSNQCQLQTARCSVLGVRELYVWLYTYCAHA